MRATKSRAITVLSFQSARARAITPTATAVAVRAFRATVIACVTAYELIRSRLSPAPESVVLPDTRSASPRTTRELPTCLMSEIDTPTFGGANYAQTHLHRNRRADARVTRRGCSGDAHRSGYCSRLQLSPYRRWAVSYAQYK